MADSRSPASEDVVAICSGCFSRTPGKDARFCKHCGEVLRHPCPRCGELIETGTAAAETVIRCPWPLCAEPLWQCRTCAWIASVGTERCVNPSCPPGSLGPVHETFQMLCGASSRSNQHTFEPIRKAARRWRMRPAPVVSVPGRVVSLVPGPACFTTLTEAGELFTIELGTSVDWAAEVRRIPSTRRLVPEPVVDPLASWRDTLFVLASDGARRIRWSRNGVEPLSHLAGRFVAQVLNAEGWFLVEAIDLGVRLHRLSHEGTPQCAPVDWCDPSGFNQWAPPAADDDCVYWTDLSGQAWRCGWSDGQPEKIGSPVAGAASVAIGPDGLYVLPLRHGGPARRIDVATGAEQTFISPDRRLCALALASCAVGRYLWMGATGAERVEVRDRQLLTQEIDVPSVATDDVQHLAAIHLDRTNTAVVAACSGAGGVWAAGWWSTPPFESLPPLGLVGAHRPSGEARITCCDPWMAFWYSTESEGFVHLGRWEPET